MYKLNNVYIGIVVNNQDWENRGRVQVFIPHLSNTLYKGWNESGEDIKFKSFESSVFTPDIISRLTDVLPWSEMAMPFFGGGTGAPVNQSTYTPTPAPTFMTYGSTGGIAPSTSFPVGKNNYDLNAIVKNSNGGNSGAYFNGLSVSGDVKNLNSVFAQRVAGFANELQAAGYKVNINSGFRAPTMAEKNQIGSTGTDQETLFKQNNGRGTARPYESNHGQGIAADITISGTGKFGYINVTTISTEKNDDENKRSSELAVLEKKWGLDIPVAKEYWHYQPLGTKNETVSFAEIAALNNNNVPAFSSGASVEGVAQNKPPHPELDGMNNTQGEVSNQNKQSVTSSTGLYSDNLLAFIRDKEGYSDTAYKDGTQYSIGYGTVAKSPTEIIDKNEAELRLRKEIDQSANLANKELSQRGYNNLTQSQKESLYSYTYNRGLGGLKQLLNNSSNSWESISSNMPKYWGSNQSAKNGLINRRNAEVAYANSNGENYNNSNQPNNIMKPTGIFENSGNGVAKIGGAGTAMGMFSIPQVGSKAYVMFLDGNPLKPIVVGCYQEPSNVRSS